MTFGARISSLGLAMATCNLLAPSGKVPWVLNGFEGKAGVASKPRLVEAVLPLQLEVSSH